jgi:hypothetical protein
MDNQKKYFVREKQKITTEHFCNKVRERLNLTKAQLSDRKILKVCKINNTLIGDWIINNVDGFRIKNNGIIIVSKYLPKCLRGDKLEKIEEILNNPKNDDYMKKMFISRYEKSMEYYKKWIEGKKSYHVNLHSFFYLYRIIWFNSRNCQFDKAEIYEFQACEKLKNKLSEKIIEGKDYYEWQFSDWRERKRDKLKPKKEK